MTTLRTPNNIDVLIHYHVSLQPHERIHAPAVIEATEMLLNEGAIVPAPDGRKDCYTTTRKGKAWLAALENVPCPQEAYIDEHGRVLPV